MAITAAQRRACILAKGGAPCLQSHSLASARPQPRAWILRRAFKPVQPGAAAGRVRCYSTSEERPYTITTPLYYVNAAPHMGSAYPTIAADVVARFQRLAGRSVNFLTGTDEHGEKIALAAEKRGLSPQAHCDAIVGEYKSLWSDLHISYDRFVRTTDSSHERIVQQVLDRVWSRGDIYKASYSGWYCVDCEEYKDEKEMDGEHNCPTHRKPCAQRSEENYFFRLSKYQAQLEQLISGDFVQPSYRRNEVAGWIKEGARDFSISRSAVTWGIPMQQDPAQTVYVWFDALNGYISGLLPPGAQPDLEVAAAAGWPADVHVIGKDILRFHAVYWPAMLLSAGLPLPGRVFGHGFLTKDGLKMGKSLGNVLEPRALVGAYGPDAVRFYFMKEISFGQDGDFSEEHFRNTVNAALANNVGNMLNRTLNLLKKNCGGALPVGADELPADHPLREAAARYMPEAAAAYGELRFHSALEAVLALTGVGNAYLEQTAPWTALKKGDDVQKEEAGRVLVAVLETARIAAIGLLPVCPALAQRMLQQLGLPEEEAVAARWADVQWGALKRGHATADPKPVFARIEGDFVIDSAPAAAAGARR